MAKKLIVFMVLLIILVLGVSLYFTLKPEKEYFSDNPTTWVEKGKITSSINVEKASKGQSFDHITSVYWSIGGTTTAFFYKGFYAGEYFEKEYAKDGEVLLRIGPNMNLNDGIIEGFAVERIVEGRYEVLLFVDEDWKRNLPSTNIVWGRTYTREKAFAFNEISDGIYMDLIEDDPKRFSFNHLQKDSGIVVGDITAEQAREGNLEGVTAMFFQ